MKKNTVLTGTLLGLTTATFIFSGCMRPTERPSVEDKSIAGKTLAIKEVPQVTDAKASVLKTALQDDMLKAADAKVSQVDLEGSKVEELLKNVKNKATKSELDAQLAAKGSIAIVVLDDQIKILKVVPDTMVSAKYEVLSRKYLGKLKEFALKPVNKYTTEAQAEALEWKVSNPSKFGEKFGLVEITALKVEKFGTLEDARTDYGDRKSLIVMKETPFEMATHVLLGGEISSATGELLDPPTAEEAAAAAKAAAEAAK